MMCASTTLKNLFRNFLAPIAIYGQHLDLMSYLRITLWFVLWTASQPLNGIASQPTPTPGSGPRRFSFSPIPVDGPYVALTFDDGPDPTHTPKLLDLLAAHHAKATFFVIGKRVAQCPEIVARAAREGHEIGNHSWSHRRFVDISDADVREELEKTDAEIRAVIGVGAKVMRPPGGAIFAQQEAWIREEFGYKTILWDVHGFDWIRPPPSPAAISERIVERIHPGAVIVCHDTQPATIEAVPAILSRLEAKQFKFVTVSELLQLGPTNPSKSDPK